ncbi:10740_t:CDS:2 [Entrophospora sp. SA101]|nr:10740_t:CDS:2 [Entrophospora sp. SA101]
MAPIHTLNSGSTVAENFQGRGYKLDSTRERELESERNELLIKTKFFANKCSDFRNAKVLAETRSDELAKELKSKNEKILLGMRFRGGHKFKKSDTITLEPEPSNTYDKNAIKIMVDGTHKAYVAKDENVSIGDLMKKYPNYRITAHGKKNYNKSASLNLEYPWMVCERCRDTLQASRDYIMIEAVIYIDSQRAHDLDREIILQKIYYRPDGYYRTVEKMHNACKKAGYIFSLNDIKEWLEKQILYLIHKPRPRFIQLVIKDVATRYRKSFALTNKSASTVAKAIKKIYEDSSHSLSWPNVFRTDKGTEYLAECKDLLLSHDVYFDPKKSKRSNAIGERDHQEFEKHAYIRQDAVDFLLPLSERCTSWVKDLCNNDDIYNDTPTRLIHMSPNEAVKRALKGEKIIADPSVKHRRPIGFNEPRLSYKDSVLYLLEPGELEFGKRRITDMNWSTKVYRIKESLIQKNQP